MAIDFQPQIDFEPEQTPSQPSLGQKVLDTVNAPFELTGEAIRVAGEGNVKSFRAPSIVQDFMPSTKTEEPPTNPFTKTYQGLEGIAHLPMGLQRAKDVVTGKPDIAAEIGGVGLALGTGEAGNAPARAAGKAIEGIAKPIVEGLGEIVNTGLAKLSKWRFGASVSEKAANIAKEAKFNLPTPTQPEIEQAVVNVQDALENAKNDLGSQLNAAKEKIGIPTTPEGRAKSLAAHDNLFNITHADALKSTEGEPFAAPSYKWKEQGDKQYYRLWGDQTQVNNKTLGAHVTGSDVSQEAVDRYNIPVKQSPYIQEFKDRKELSKAITSFQADSSKMTKTVRGRVASFLQDQINNHVDWKGSEDALGGLLKKQYGHLGDVIHDSSVELPEKKASFAEAKQLFDSLDKKLGISKDEPGKAEKYLRNLFTTNNPASKDDLAKLAKLQTITGQPVIDTLFHMFTGEQFGKLAGSPKLASAAAMETAGSLYRGNLPGVASGLTYLAAQSPALLKNAGRAAALSTEAASKLASSKLPNLSALSGLNSLRRNPDLHSLRDRLKNGKK